MLVLLRIAPLFLASRVPVILVLLGIAHLSGECQGEMWSWRRGMANAL
jgi:hypothetical protein